MFHRRVLPALSLLLGVLVLLVVESQEFDKTRRKMFMKYDTPVTQHQAFTACRRLGGRLAVPMNEEESWRINRLIGASYETDPWPAYWISGSDEQEEGIWKDSNTGKKLRYTNFQEKQPDNYGGKEHCIEVSPTYPKWNDRDCENVAKGYLCEYPDE